MNESWREEEEMDEAGRVEGDYLQGPLGHVGEDGRPGHRRNMTSQFGKDQRAGR